MSFANMRHWGAHSSTPVRIAASINIMKKYRLGGGKYLTHSHWISLSLPLNLIHSCMESNLDSWLKWQQANSVNFCSFAWVSLHARLNAAKVIFNNIKEKASSTSASLFFLNLELLPRDTSDSWKSVLSSGLHHKRWTRIEPAFATWNLKYFLSVFPRVKRLDRSLACFTPENVNTRYKKTYHPS